jgi:hypothetical protein
LPVRRPSLSSLLSIRVVIHHCRGAPAPPWGWRGRGRLAFPLELRQVLREHDEPWPPAKGRRGVDRPQFTARDPATHSIGRHPEEARYILRGVASRGLHGTGCRNVSYHGGPLPDACAGARLWPGAGPPSASWRRGPGHAKPPIPQESWCMWCSCPSCEPQPFCAPKGLRGVGKWRDLWAEMRNVKSGKGVTREGCGVAVTLPCSGWSLARAGPGAAALS